MAIPCKKSICRFVIFLCVSFGAGQSIASDRVALVIGNAAYEEAPLVNPINDAQAMSQRLESLGFKVFPVLDADLESMQQAVIDFMNEVTEESTALVFFAGHGIQANGRNYLIPVDASLNDERSLRFEALELNDILEELEEIEAKINIVILDACRNNPFARRFRGGSRGLAVVDAAQGTLIAYATAPGSVASDGYGDNGLYTQELLKALEQPGLKVEEVFKNVRRQVSEMSGGEQLPWESSSLVGDFVFNQTAPAKPQETELAEVAGPITLAPDQILWDVIADSDDALDFQRYLERYPEGLYAGLAEKRYRNLANNQRGCADLSGEWRAWLQDAPADGCKDTFSVRSKGDNQYGIDYAVCGAMGAVTNIRGIGSYQDHVLSFKWRSMPCSGTTEYSLDKSCQTGTGRVVKRGGLPGVCNVMVNKNLIVNIERNPAN